ncbi:MAG: hypothetical protein OXF20_09730 [Gammaproteobacteria bacterium]|nr:hypothetical protein [Gammaproteobacteria bacterium]
MSTEKQLEENGMTQFQETAKSAGLNFGLGLQGIKSAHRDQILVKGDASVTGSIDLDSHFKKVEPSANRWDDGIGLKRVKEFAFWVDARPANSTGDIDAIIEKLTGLKSKLDIDKLKHLATLTGHTKEMDEIPFRWMYKGKGGSYRRQGIAPVSKTWNGTA